jgi:hypothetical protein
MAYEREEMPGDTCKREEEEDMDASDPFLLFTSASSE